MNLYSPPGGEYPQELPDRWRFPGGMIMNNLQSLTDQQLSSIDWIGPIQIPTPHVIDTEDNIVETYDYDPRTQKIAWYRYFRKFIIVDTSINELIYQDSTSIISDIQYYDPIDNGDNSTDEKPQEPDWKKFRTGASVLKELNDYILQIFPYYPLMITSIPDIFNNLTQGSYDDFIFVWTSMVNTIPPPPELIEKLIDLAKESNSPEEFIAIFKQE